MINLTENQLIKLEPVDQSFDPLYFRRPTNALNAIPRMNVNVYRAIQKHLPIIYKDKVCYISVVDGSDITWGNIDIPLKQNNGVTRSLTNKLFKAENLTTGEIHYYYRAVKITKIYNIPGGTLSCYKNNGKMTFKRIVNDQVYEFSIIDGTDIKFKNIEF